MQIAVVTLNENKAYQSKIAKYEIHSVGSTAAVGVSVGSKKSGDKSSRHGMYSIS